MTSARPGGEGLIALKTRSAAATNSGGLPGFGVVAALGVVMLALNGG